MTELAEIARLPDDVLQAEFPDLLEPGAPLHWRTIYPALPKGPFSIIYPDPPWDYKGQNFVNGDVLTSAADWHYDCISYDQLALLPVASIAAPDALLFMWTTGPLLDEAIFLMHDWGFAYKTIAFVWDKQRVNPGYYTMSQTEIVIVGKRGKIPTPRGARNVRQFLSEERGKHSEKPNEIRRRIEEMFPEQRRVELFSNSDAPGWTHWGLGH